MTINIPDVYIFHSAVSILLLCLGFIVWFFYYGLELFLNGAHMQKSPFYYAYQELMCILPGGWKRKLKYCENDIELAKSLPGISHFVFTHILIPFGLFFLYMLLVN